jgi:integrase
VIVAYRNGVLTRAFERANDKLEEADGIPLPAGLRPHSLRRTFASVLYALGHDPAYVMAQLGHTKPSLALAIYAKAMRLEDGDKDRLRGLVNGSEWADAGRRGDERSAGDSDRHEVDGPPFRS